jgi:hypothetical protein
MVNRGMDDYLSEIYIWDDESVRAFLADADVLSEGAEALAVMESTAYGVDQYVSHKECLTRKP